VILDKDTAKSIYMIRGSAPDAFNHLVKFFTACADRAVKDAADTTTNPALQNQALGRWRAWDFMANIERTAEIANGDR